MVLWFAVIYSQKCNYNYFQYNRMGEELKTGEMKTSEVLNQNPQSFLSKPSINAQKNLCQLIFAKRHFDRFFGKVFATLRP